MSPGHARAPRAARRRAVRPRAWSLLAAVPVLLAGCGPSLATMVTEAMDRCIEARNPAFTGGQGTTALDVPLDPRAAELAGRLAYLRAHEQFAAIAEVAADQVTLVCALDYASRYRHPDARRFVARYTRHPDAAVAASAERLLARGTAEPRALPATGGASR